MMLTKPPSVFKYAVLTINLFLSSTFAGELPEFTTLIKNNAPTVVQIDAKSHQIMSKSSAPEELLRYFYEERGLIPRFARPQQFSAHGSGFFIDNEGYILTNAHVVNGSDEITISTTDQTEYKATLIGLDERTDVALLKIDKTGLPAAKIGNSDSIEVGNWVLAIGSPFGFDFTATKGIISAVSRSLPDGTYVPFIQTDAAVNPGNSGGPLFNLQGEVIGINSQIYSRTGTFNGLAFAIPINTAMNVAQQLKEKGYVNRGWLGVAIQSVDPNLAQTFGLKKPRGALVTKVFVNSPAEKAGIQSGDIILSLNHKEIKKSNQLPPIVGTIKAGQTITANIMSKGKEKTVTITIGELKENKKPLVVATNTTKHGLQVANLSNNQKFVLAIENGVVVTKITAESRAQKVGFEVGDVIVNINNRVIDSVTTFHKVMNEMPADAASAVLVIRKGRSLFIPL